jgi:UDP-glucose 4-epimerase
MTTWLVTGGAGYIGSHVSLALRQAGHDVVVLDDLSTGRATRLPSGLRLHVGSVLDTASVVNVMRAYRVDGVVHLAGKKAVQESVSVPLHYYRENLDGMRSVLTAMQIVGVRRIVFSSTAAIYGSPASSLVTEETPLAPMSPYGRTKLVCEWMLWDAAEAHDLSCIALRYFNVAGTASRELADDARTNLIPSVLRALLSGTAPSVFGDDYPTPDGTCIRDYVHPLDVASAHVVAAQDLLRPPRVVEAFNVGRGRGDSVLEVLHAVASASGQRFGWQIQQRRPGDPAELVACTSKIHERWGWRARHDLQDIVRSAWAVVAEQTEAGAAPPAQPREPALRGPGPRR